MIHARQCDTNHGEQNQDHSKGILLTADGQVQDNAVSTASGAIVPPAVAPVPAQQAPDAQRKDQKPRSPFSIMLAEAIKNSTNPEIPKLKDEIDEIKKQRGTLISTIKATRRRLMYKESEAVAIGRLLTIEKGKEAGNEKRKRIGYLKRLKNKLEFMVSTEASSLAAEKELVRKIEEVNKELNEAYKMVRLERKSEFVKKDVDTYKAQLQELETKIADMDKRLDELYDKLRKMLGIAKQKEEFKAKKKPSPQQPLQEINLEDIAVIKKKGKKEKEPEPSEDSGA